MLEKMVSKDGKEHQNSVPSRYFDPGPQLGKRPSDSNEYIILSHVLSANDFA
jgi:hypothetical protein